MTDYSGCYVVVDPRFGMTLPMALEAATGRLEAIEREYPDQRPHQIYVLTPYAEAPTVNESDPEVSALVAGVEAHITAELKAKPFTVWVHTRRANRVSGPLELPDHVYTTTQAAQSVVEERGGMMQEFSATGRDLVKRRHR